jgi:RNA polymerase sigma-70 factor (ECF subfamily)
VTSPPAVDALSSDEALMVRFANGDEAAFNLLFDRYAGLLHRYLARLCASSSVADDLLQATFLSVVRGRGRFRSDGRLRPWLYAIATNAARDWARKRARPEQLTDTGELPEQAAPDAPELTNLGTAQQVREAMHKLSDSQREAVVMHRLEGLSFAEIGEALGISEGAVRVRAHRGYERLRQLLANLKRER